MNVVSDTSPICYLLLIGHVEILPALFGRIAVPTAVRDELAHPKVALGVREWALDPPPWLEVHFISPEPAPDLGRLDRGEREAILLAARRQANLLEGRLHE